MAYDMSAFQTASSTSNWLQLWATREFGSSVASSTASIIATYGKLIVRRKYELLNQSPFLYNIFNYNEAENVLLEWQALERQTQAVYDTLDADTQTSFFEMVLHPVMAGRVVQQVYINAARNAAYAKQKRMSTNTLADDVKSTYAQDAVIQKRYHSLLDGKWNHVMDQLHFGYDNWQDPTANTMPAVTTISTIAPSTGLLGVSVQGSSASMPGDAAPDLLSLSPYTPENRTIDIYARGSGSVAFTITPSVPYITVTPSSGTISYPSGTSDIRAIIHVDWTKAPTGNSTATLSIKPHNNGTQVLLTLPLTKDVLPPDFKGYVQANGAIAIEMQHFTSRTPGSNGATVDVIPDYGRTDSGLTLLPISAGTQTPSTGPKAIYTFYATSTSPAANLTVYMPPSFNVDPQAPFRYAFALDNGTPTVVSPVPSSTLGAMPRDWRDSVVNGARVVTSGLGRVERGVHRLNLWLLEPGTVVQRVVLDMGGLEASYLGPPESVRVGF
jgi:hypothetical protein